MRSVNCAGCGKQIKIPDTHHYPFIKCKNCGSQVRIPPQNLEEPKYKILTPEQRQKISQTDHIPNESSSEGEKPPEQQEDKPEKSTHSPVYKSKSSAGWPEKPPTHKKKKNPIDTRKILLDALGHEGLEMVFQMVAGYLAEVDENKKRMKKNRVIQNIMRSKITADIAARAVVFAEKAEETQTILWNNYKFGVFVGFGIFAAGLLISIFVHLLANPGRGFFLFQVPFAVGLAYAANSAFNMLELKFNFLRSVLVHYIFMTFLTLLIAVYVIWGLFF
jgi:DNA-directed RNA polymerase subunit RPC12/RpoP